MHAYMSLDKIVLEFYLAHFQDLLSLIQQLLYYIPFLAIDCGFTKV